MSEQEINKDAIIEGFTDEWFDKTQARDGGGFVRHPIGDYRFRIEDVGIEASKNAAKPHNMIVLTVKTQATIPGLDGAADAVGMETTLRYGTPQSPAFMQGRTKQLLEAVGLRGRFAPRALIGKEFDATVTWEKQAPTIDPVSGAEKTYVSARIAFERKAGAQRPKNAPNVKLASAAAIKYVEQLDGAGASTDSEGGAASGEAPAWETPQAPTQQTAQPTPTTAATATATTAKTWQPESVVPPRAHEYRACIKMGKPTADSFRKALADKMIDPDGPIDEAKLGEPTKGEYAAWLGAQGTPQGSLDLDLPPVGGETPPNGTAPPAASKARTGTRAPKQAGA